MQTAHRKLRVLIVDSAGLSSDGLSALIELQADFAVAGIIAGVADLRTLELQAPPDMIVGDFGASTGPELIAAAHGRWPSTPLLDLTLLSPILLQRKMRAPGNPPIRTDHAEFDGLSDREREVMKLIGRGLRTRGIAVRLSLSHKTVEKHRTNLMRKLGVRTAAAVVAYAISHGYLQ